jgi:hypothetical protein
MILPPPPPNPLLFNRKETKAYLVGQWTLDVCDKLALLRRNAGIGATHGPDGSVRRLSSRSSVALEALDAAAGVVMADSNARYQRATKAYEKMEWESPAGVSDKTDSVSERETPSSLRVAFPAAMSPCTRAIYEWAASVRDFEAKVKAEIARVKAEIARQDPTATPTITRPVKPSAIVREVLEAAEPSMLAEIAELTARHNSSAFLAICESINPGFNEDQPTIRMGQAIGIEIVRQQAEDDAADTRPKP